MFERLQAFISIPEVTICRCVLGKNNVGTFPIGSQPDKRLGIRAQRRVLALVRLVWLDQWFQTFDGLWPPSRVSQQQWPLAQLED